MFLLHERLDCYQLALELAHWAASITIPTQRKHLRNQLVRAADSIVLNIAEGTGHDGDARRNHYRIALGSACEVGAIVDLLGPADRAAVRERIVRVASMLTRMTRR